MVGRRSRSEVWVPAGRARRDGVSVSGLGAAVLVMGPSPRRLPSSAPRHSITTWRKQSTTRK